MSNRLTHIDQDGNPKMVDISHKANSYRLAIAEGWVLLADTTLLSITQSTIQKGDVLQIAQLAGIQGAKRTSDLIPLCHPLPIDAVQVWVSIEMGKGVYIKSSVRSHWRTGVEMEALTAVTAAALTVYDMVKAVDRSAVLSGICLLEKHGGKSGVWVK